MFLPYVEFTSGPRGAETSQQSVLRSTQDLVPDAVLNRSRTINRKN